MQKGDTDGVTELTTMSSPKVAVLGAGILGLSSAYVLKNSFPDIDVVLISEDFAPNVTSCGAPGFWYPGNFLGSTPWHVQEKWSLATLSWLKELYKNPNSYKYGIGRCSGYMLFDHNPELPYCHRFFDDFRILTESELQQFPDKIKYGWCITTLFCQSSRYLPYLLERFTESGGRVVKKKVSSFEELSEFDVVVNSTGLSSRKLCKDKEVYPVRGQIRRVKAPWINHFYSVFLSLEDKFIYMYPNIDFVVLGGTGQVGDENLHVSESDKEMILEENANLVPSVKNAEVVCDWVGLRPARTSVRLEKEVLTLQSGKHLKVVHNYGFGRSGITMHFGCAKDVTALVHEFLNGQYKNAYRLESKL